MQNADFIKKPLITNSFRHFFLLFLLLTRTRNRFVNISRVVIARNLSPLLTVVHLYVVRTKHALTCMYVPATTSTCGFPIDRPHWQKRLRFPLLAVFSAHATTIIKTVCLLSSFHFSPNNNVKQTGDLHNKKNPLHNKLWLLSPTDWKRLYASKFIICMSVFCRSCFEAVSFVACWASVTSVALSREKESTLVRCSKTLHDDHNNVCLSA